MALVGHRVTVTDHGPATTSAWTGKLTALADHPTLILDLDDGRRMVLQQYRCKVTPADEQPEPGQPVDPLPTHARWDRLAIMEADGEVTYTWPNVPPTADIVAGTRVHGLLDRQLDRLAETLFNSIDRLEQHIVQRAQELAQPAITQARADVEEAQEERDHWRTRFTDLQREGQRQLAPLERRAVTAETAIARALSTMFLNTTAHVSAIRATDVPLSDYQRGYQACADHVTTALNGATQEQETDRG